MELASRKFVQTQLGGRTRPSRTRVDFWNRDVDTKLVNSSHVEELRGSVRSGVDQGANIRSASRDDSIERSNHSFVGLQLFESRDVGRIGLNDRLIRSIAIDRVISFLSRYGLCVQQVYHAIRRNLRQILIGLRGCQLGTCLLELLIQLRRLNFGEQEIG